jgi:hypothetical protein
LSPARAQPARAHDSNNNSDVPATPGVKVKTEKCPTPLSSVCSLKHKSIHNHIEELTTQNHTKQIKIAQVWEHKKTVHARAKYEAKSNLEMARLAHQEREGEWRGAHSMLMLERQMQLEAP